MSAVINDRGRQYVVNDGESLLVDYIDGAEAGAEHVFDQVMAVDGTFGTPYVKGASVTALIEGQVRGPKLYVEKFKRRKDYRRRVGHRQSYTKLTIQKVSASGSRAKPAAVAESGEE